MAQWWLILLGLWTVLPSLAGGKLLNVCMNSKHHKQEPGPEDKLYFECMPWKDNACCTRDTSWEAHLDEPLLFNFSMTHCGLLTPLCHKHFIQAICFYECSPNLGPWIQPVVPNRQEEQRLWDVPLCLEDCEEWWKDCRTSHTCKADWLHGWVWDQGKNGCPAHAPCLPFSDYFPTPADLCEKIWNNTFKASPERRNSGRCLQKWFEPTHGNPNVEVALHFAGSASAPQLSYSITAFSLCLLLHA
ncbi:rCG31683, isoform CRA_a [Rattus norvegicus]|uniref:Sperm-egg fusion protein Juno n=1 Tax=Rattus norvegicus TaxID=10116 RepID=JUNO_RAT|nr:sperm-egg fusion protein Juno precursor [Rattus norvegicus]EDL78457.1 rCG31683, isoform CRA_a [Rattus norvegicus]|eukprot:XP_017451453.1 PREDICTED: sperm-egg fusion protein Juno [Rattus norvegicus]